MDENTIVIEIIYKNIKYNCYIDSEDFDKIKDYNTWHINLNKKGHVDGVRTKVQKNKVRKQIWMHNLILSKINNDNVTDHINHNTLDNRKQNLREISKKENSQNICSHLKNSKTQCRNITIERGKYRVRIGGKSFGSYSTIEEAKQVAINKRKEVFPISSNLNEKIII